MKIKVEVDLTPEEAKELMQPFSASNAEIATNMISQFQQSWFEQFQKMSSYDKKSS
jgi:hypothetical protein